MKLITDSLSWIKLIMELHTNTCFLSPTRLCSKHRQVLKTVLRHATWSHNHDILLFCQLVSQSSTLGPGLTARANCRFPHPYPWLHVSQLLCASKRKNAHQSGDWIVVSYLRFVSLILIPFVSAPKSHSFFIWNPFAENCLVVVANYLFVDHLNMSFTLLCVHSWLAHFTQPTIVDVASSPSLWCPVKWIRNNPSIISIHKAWRLLIF